MMHAHKKKTEHSNVKYGNVCIHCHNVSQSEKETVKCYPYHDLNDVKIYKENKTRKKHSKTLTKYFLCGKDSVGDIQLILEDSVFANSLNGFATAKLILMMLSQPATDICEL